MISSLRCRLAVSRDRLYLDPMPTRFFPDRFGNDMGTVIFGIVPEKEEIPGIGEALLQAVFTSAGIYLFMKLFGFFYHSRLNFIHRHLRVPKGDGPSGTTGGPDIKTTVTASVSSGRSEHPYRPHTGL